MRALPLFHRLEGEPCLVVGGGVVAARKVRWLVKAGADVHVVAPELCEELRAMETLRYSERKFAEDDVANVRLVIAATDVDEVNAQVAQAARTLNIPVNVVDNGELSTVIFPSIVDRDPVTLAISTGGESPTLARWLRGRLEVLLPRNLGWLAQFLGNKRRELAAHGETPPRAFWEAIVAAGADRAETTFAELRSAEPKARKGQVAIVGAGPGDPELITVKALQLLLNADLVLYDNLVNAEILDYARRDAELRYVGKKRAYEGARQEDINRQLVEAAENGSNVVRLKGGDPFIFGRGGEEIATIAGRGIDCIIVPGITAALGAASYAGIPLTYRNVSLSVRFITGHAARGSQDLDWSGLAKPDQTLVFYMGLFNLREIAAQLVKAGLASETPVALVENATLPDQRVVEGTLKNIGERAEEEGVNGPTTVIVGEVVRFRSEV